MQDSLSKPLKTSIIIHLGLIVFLILKSIVSPFEASTKEYIPSLRVDLVALPDQKTIEQITPAVPAAAEETKPEPVKKEKIVTTPTEEKGDYSTHKKQNKKERMKSALERIKSLEKIKAGESIKGNQIRKGSSAKGTTTDSVQTTYIDMVLDKVRNEWELPQWLQEKNLTAKVLIKIDRRGMITSMRFLKNSGNEQFDAAVKRTLQAAVPFSAPPLSILAEMASEGIVFGFPIAE